MRIAWVDYPYGAAEGGDALGYAGMAASLRVAMERIGVRFDGVGGRCIALHVASPGFFGRSPDAVRWMKRRDVTHVCFTMWEGFDLIAGEAANLARADVLVTPNAWCTAHLAHRTGKPGSTIPLGHTPVPYRERPPTLPTDRPFRWLLVGATNPRKGLAQLAGAWDSYFADKTAMTLLIKSTYTSDVRAKLAAEAAATGTDRIIATQGNLTHDARMLPRAELDQIYDQADAFVLPTMGEGWGFPVIEAMSAGLPVVATGCQGILEYADTTVATLLPWRWQAIGSRKASMTSDAPDGTFRYCYVHPDAIAAGMLAVMTDYPAAVARAKAAALRATAFTWERCAGRLANLLAIREAA